MLLVMPCSFESGAKRQGTRMIQQAQLNQENGEMNHVLLAALEKSLPNEQAQSVYALIRELQLGREISLETQVLQTIELQAFKERLTFLRLLERRIAVYTKSPASVKAQVT